MALVGLCTPNWGLIAPDFYQSVLGMQNQFRQHQFLHVEIGMQIVGKARNDLVKTALGANVDVIWFIDSDVLVPLNSGILIDQALKLGIVSGLYFGRRPPYTPQLYQRAKEKAYEVQEVYFSYTNNLLYWFIYSVK